MLFRYRYHVKRSPKVSHGWPLEIDDKKFEFHVDSENHIIFIDVFLQLPKGTPVPTFDASPSQKGVHKMHIPSYPDQEDVEAILRTLQGTMSIFQPLSINFQDYVVKWIPENAREENLVTINDIHIQRRFDSNTQDQVLHYEFLARALTATPKLRHNEIPLNFLRIGHINLEEDRYIEAFYNFFFFLESQYAPNVSNPKNVRKRLLKSKHVLKGISTARAQLSGGTNVDNARKLPDLLALDDDELVERLVYTRGHLHHHSNTSPDKWHPDNQSQFRSEAILMQHICQNISIGKVIDLMYENSTNAALSSNAKKHYAIQRIIIRPFNTQYQTLKPDIFNMIGLTPDATMILAAHQEYRTKIANFEVDEGIKGFEIFANENSEVLARYEIFKND